MGTLAFRAINAAITEQRTEISKEDRERLRTLQCNECNVCHSELPSGEHRAVHLDHKIPLYNGGAHEFENFQLLCSYCHDAKTQAEEEARALMQNEEPFRGLYSALSPITYKLLMGPNSKPNEQTGRFIPEDKQPSNSSLFAYDICGCRPNMLTYASYKLPVLHWSDTWKEVGNCMNYDLYLWQGRIWPRDAIEKLMNADAVKREEIECGLSASGSARPTRLGKAFELVRKCFRDMGGWLEMWYPELDSAEDLAKNSILAAIGVMTRCEKDCVTYSTTYSDCSGDHMKRIDQQRRLRTGAPEDEMNPEWAFLTQHQHATYYASPRVIGPVS